MVSYPNETVVASLNATVTSGAVVTLIFNGDGALLTQFVVEAVLDKDYISTYSTCYVRVLNSVANADYSALTPVYTPGAEVLFENITYGELSDYAELEAGVTYTIFFAQDGATPAEIADSPSLDLFCQPSQYYTLTYQGLPGTVFTPLTTDLYFDETTKPYYLQADVRVTFLSTSYTTELMYVSLNGVQFGAVGYDSPTRYIQVDSESVNITIVSLDEGTVWTDTFDVSLGQKYTYSVLGLSNSQEYPLSAVLAEDSPVDDEPTTTTTTGTTGTTSGTTGTTGSHDDDDDDDDDDLSGGEVAGIVIGVIAGVAILGGLIFFVVRRQRRAQFSTIG